MVFARNLYAGKVAETIRDRFLAALENGTYQEGYYIIVLSETGHDLLEVLPLVTFQNPVYLQYHDISALRVVGISVTKEEADQLMKRIVMEVYHATGGFDMEQYFEFDGDQDA